MHEPLSDTPQISVISAWYNRPEDLEASVRSVLDQEGVSLEYIVVDDASTDEETRTRLAAFSDPRLRLVRNEANMGFTRSMRRAAAMARAPFVAVHDAGDISLPGRLAAQAAYLGSHSDHVAVGCAIRNLDVETGRATYPEPQEGTERPFPNYTHGEVMFRREAYEAAGGYRELFYYSQDSDLWWRLSEHGGMGFLRDVLYERRVFAEGVASDPGKLILQAVFANLGTVSGQARAAGRPDPIASRNALPLLQQTSTPHFLSRASWRTKQLLKARRYAEARAALSAVPVGMMNWRMLMTFVALKAITRGRAVR